jgi:anti-anti-sigma factor
MRSELSLTSRHQDQLLPVGGPGGAKQVRIILCGDLDDLTARQLQTTVIEVLRRERPDRIDIDQVAFLDTAGIKALLLCRTDASQVDCQIRLTNPQPVARRVLQIVGLLKPFGLDSQ